MATRPTDLNIGIDDVVASAASGVLRAFEARKIGAERLTVPDLVQAGFNVRFEIWAGGPFIRDFGQFGGNNPAGGGIRPGG